MYGLRSVAFLFVLFALVSSVLVIGIEALDAEDMAVSAVEGAEQAVAEAYEIILGAEEAGANVSALLDRLDVAAEYLALARMCLRIGDFDRAVGNASFCVEGLDGLVGDAGALRDRAVGEWRERSWMAIGGSVVAVVAVACGCWLGWRSFRTRHYKRVVEMKPEVVEDES